MTSRTVAENTVAGEDIGNPVAANDANGDALDLCPEREPMPRPST